MVFLSILLDLTFSPNKNWVFLILQGRIFKIPQVRSYLGLPQLVKRAKGDATGAKKQPLMKQAKESKFIEKYYKIRWNIEIDLANFLLFFCSMVQIQK